MDAWILLSRGFLIGLAIAAPVGPIGVLCIRRTLMFGRSAGLLSGLGAASADALYGAVAAAGLIAVSLWFKAANNGLQLVGGLFLCFLGLRSLFGKPEKPQADDFSGSSSGIGLRHPHRSGWVDFSTTFLLTLTNPMTILSFSAIIAGIGGPSLETSSRSAAWMIVLGVFLGSAAWWLTLSSVVAALQARFFKPVFTTWLTRGSGLILLGFGLVALLSPVMQMLME